MNETERQNKIDELALRMQTCASIALRRVYWAEMRELIKGRSPETVSAMERRRGIYTEGK